MIYEKIKNDIDINNLLIELDKKETEICHGLTHSLNVIDNIEKLCNLLNINNDDTNLLKVAAYLHDIGHINGKENHELKSYEYVKEYLKDKLDKNNYYKIINAIKNHHKKDNIDTISLFDHILLFADKMDFSYKRVNKSIKKYLLEKDILEINFDIKDNVFYIYIKTNNLTNDDFINWSYYNKVVTKRIGEFASRLKMDYKIKIF